MATGSSASLIDSTEAVLRNLGLIRGTGRVPVNISFLRGTLIELFPDGGGSVVVKTSRVAKTDNLPFALEFNALKHQAEAHPGLAPIPIALEQRAGFNFLVMRGVSHRPAGIGDLTAPNVSGLIELASFLGEPGDGATPNRPPLPSPLSWAAAVAHLPDDLQHRLRALAGRRDWSRLCADLPEWPQHSDLAINNLGFSDKGFVLFDWEDFGRITLPGFDLCILIASGCQFDPDRIMAALSTMARGEENAVLDQAAAMLPLARDRLPELMVISLVMFHALKIKHGYGDAVISICRGAIAELANRL